MNHEGTKVRREGIPAEADIPLDAGLRLDWSVEDRVVVEFKALEAAPRVHTARMLAYHEVSGHRLSLLINFPTALIKQGIHRIAL